jgi:hypothetical protein
LELYSFTGLRKSNIQLRMLCLPYAYNLQRLNTVGLNGRQPLCSALRIVNPVCCRFILLCCTEVTNTDFLLTFEAFLFVEVHCETT